MLTLEKAKELLNTSTTEPHLFLHAKNVMAAMGGLAEHFGADAAHWMAIGYLHDYDYEQHPEEHLQYTAEPLRAAGLEEAEVRAILAHGYGIMDSNFSHDSLNEFNGLIFGNQWKIQLGRFLIPVYRNFSRTDLTLPWLIGILGLLWCGLAVYLVIRIFQIENPFLIFMTAGIFTANLTISA